MAAWLDPGTTAMEMGKWKNCKLPKFKKFSRLRFRNTVTKGS
jgi:hypothetical protein